MNKNFSFKKIIEYDELVHDYMLNWTIIESLQCQINEVNFEVINLN
jgi:hypothetical protein